MRTYKHIFSVLLFLIPVLSVALPNANLATKSSSIQTLVNQYLDRYKSGDTKNKSEYISAIQVSVDNNGSVKTYVAGSSQHKLGVPVTNESLFAWGSITKEFTAAVILHLQDRGLLNLNQTLADWFPDKFINSKEEKSSWPQAWAKVSVAELLNMTSGIPNFYTKDFLNKRDLFLTNWQPDALVQRSIKYYRSGKCMKKEECFSPGTNYSYSNTNYIIASMIATKAAQVPFEIQMRNLLNQSRIKAYYYPHIAPAQYLRGKIVSGYFFDAPAYGNLPVKNVPLGFDTINTVQLSTGADGALIGNTENMVAVIHKLFTGKILSKKATAILNNEDYVNEKDGSPVTNLSRCTAQNTNNEGCFGLGVNVVYDNTFGPIWTYEGEVGGFRSYYMWIPKKNVLISASVNSSVSSFGGSNDNLGTLVNNIASKFLVTHKVK